MSIKKKKKKSHYNLPSAFLENGKNLKSPYGSEEYDLINVFVGNRKTSGDTLNASWRYFDRTSFLPFIVNVSFPKIGRQNYPRFLFLSILFLSSARPFKAGRWVEEAPQKPSLAPTRTAGINDGVGR